MFFSRNKKINVYPCKPQFYCIKVGFKGVKLYRCVFVMERKGTEEIVEKRKEKYKGECGKKCMTVQKQMKY